MIGLFWLEDVTTADDYQGLARVTAALKTPIAGGEYVWGITPFRQMIVARSVDIVMIDICARRRRDAVAEGRGDGRGVQPAGRQPCDAGGPCAPGGGGAERTDRGVHAVDAELFEETPRIEQGQLVLPDKPGFGLKFDEAAVKSFRVA